MFVNLIVIERRATHMFSFQQASQETKSNKYQKELLEERDN